MSEASTGESPKEGEKAPDLKEMLAKANAEIETLRTHTQSLEDDVHKAREKKREATEKAEAEALETAKAKGDTVSLTKSYEDKIKFKDDTIKSMDDEIKGIREATKKEKLDGQSAKFAALNAIEDEGSQEYIEMQYRNRLDYRDGKTVVLDAAGNLTALSLDDLKNEFIGAGKYARHLKGTSASGGGATGSGSNSGSATTIDPNSKAGRVAKIQAKLNKNR